MSFEGMDFSGAEAVSFETTDFSEGMGSSIDLSAHTSALVGTFGQSTSFTQPGVEVAAHAVVAPGICRPVDGDGKVNSSAFSSFPCP